MIDNDNDSKWAKNGFGDNVSKRTSGGKFTKEESELVRQAVLEFCAAKQISVDRLCSECEHKAELKGSWNEISRALPHRSVQSVYRHGLRLLHPFKRGAWTEEEIHKLIELVTRLGKKWVACQKALNRSADSCRDKYREMSDLYVKGRWKEHETIQLIKLVKQHLRVDPSMHIVEVGKMVEAENIVIPWSTISTKMGNRSRLSCFKKFQKMTGLFSPSDTGNRVKQRVPGAPHTASGLASPQLQGRAAVQHEEQSTHTTSDASSTIDEALMGGIAGTTTGAAGGFLGRDDGQDVVEQQQLGHVAEPTNDVDMFLLSELASSGANRTNDVDWGSMRVDDGQERWQDLVMEWQQQEGEEATEDALLTLPFYELAQLLLDRKASAKMAAETVEAVDLPTV